MLRYFNKLLNILFLSSHYGVLSTFPNDSFTMPIRSLIFAMYASKLSLKGFLVKICPNIFLVFIAFCNNSS